MIRLCRVDALYVLFFFFSSRRRHTRFDCDWSSDVCSSDLKTWKKPRILHTDRKPGEHGFASMVPLAKGGVAVAWLDSREMTPGGHHGHEGAMTLRYAEVDSALAISRESLLDARVCECCTTGMAM